MLVGCSPGDPGAPILPLPMSIGLGKWGEDGLSP